MAQTRSLLRIFVVDDEHVIASTMALILRFSGGFHATSFNAPLEALLMAKNDQPDLLISDVVMPGLSGIDLAIQLKQQCPNCKILLFSGQAASESLLESARAQGHEFELLSKPVHPAKLLARIQDLLEEVPAMPLVG